MNYGGFGQKKQPEIVVAEEPAAKESQPLNYGGFGSSFKKSETSFKPNYQGFGQSAAQPPAPLPDELAPQL